MFNYKRLLVLITVTLLAACGGGSDSFVAQPVIDPITNVPVVEIDKIEALTSNTQLQSDGGLPVTITALVKNVDNNLVEGANVSFSVDSGDLQVTNSVTGQDGRATALLTTQGDPTNRVITVTTTTNNIANTVSVTVIGTTLQIVGPSALAQGAAGAYSLVLNNAEGAGIGGKTVDITSSLGNTLSAQSLTTDSAGQAQFTYTAVNGGTDTLTASALGETALATVVVSDDSFAFINPAEGTEVTLGASQAVTLRWTQNNAPVIGQSVRFAATRGTISPASVVTNANGEANASISATNSGQSTISATTLNGPTATVDVEFVATQPNSIEVQADPFTVLPNSQSAITAVVRDPSSNLVKNVTVNFELTDITGGRLSLPSAVTDSQGRAQTFYTASSVTSRVDGVSIKAVVSGTGIEKSVQLTVAGRQLFFNFGTGNQIFEPNPAQYQKPYVVQVTDADGRGVPDVDVTMAVVSVNYVKGYWCFDSLDDAWDVIVRDRCDDEDFNRNGILDPGEDTNGSTRIEAGNVATVIPGAFVSDANGFGFIDIYYPQQFGSFLEVQLQARAGVQGSEFSKSSVFLLSNSADDTNDENVQPPGLRTVPANFFPPNVSGCAITQTQNNGVIQASPFGYNPGCGIYDFPN